MDPSVQFLTVINKVSRQYALRTYCPNTYTYRHQREAFPARCHTSLQPKVHTFSGVSLGRNSKVIEFHSSKILAKLPVLLSFCLFIGLAVRIQKKVPTKKLVLGIGDVWRFWTLPNWFKMSMSDPLNHLGSIWYHSELSDLPYFPWDLFLLLLTARLS